MDQYEEYHKKCVEYHKESLTKAAGAWYKVRCGNINDLTQDEIDIINQALQYYLQHTQ